MGDELTEPAGRDDRQGHDDRGQEPSTPLEGSTVRVLGRVERGREQGRRPEQQQFGPERPSGGQRQGHPEDDDRCRR